MGVDAVMVIRPRTAASLRGVSPSNETFTLADGTVVVCTTRGGTDKEEMVSLSLGDTRDTWQAERTPSRS